MSLRVKYEGEAPYFFTLWRFQNDFLKISAGTQPAPSEASPALRGRQPGRSGTKQREDLRGDIFPHRTQVGKQNPMQILLSGSWTLGEGQGAPLTQLGAERMHHS